MRVIIIGGTGMLSQAAREITRQASDVLLLARHPDELAKALGVRSLTLNWKDKKSVQAAMASLELEPKVDILLSWIHDDGVWCLPLFENCLVEGGRSIRVHGSAVGDPSQGVEADPVSPRKDIVRQHVVLGWVEETKGRRWLTNDEISQGALTAFKNADNTAIVVGQLDYAERSKNTSSISRPKF